jgi:hypothetical protein
MFHIENALKQGDVLSSLPFDFSVGYAITRILVNQNGLKLNGAHQLLVYADDVNILGRSEHTIRKRAEAITIASKKIGLEVNADRTKYLVISRDKSTGRSHSVRTGNSSFERMGQFIYLGTTLRNQKYIRGEITKGLKSGNACYHSVQNLLSSSLLTKNIKIQIRYIKLQFCLLCRMGVKLGRSHSGRNVG